MAHSNEIPFLHGAPFAPVVRFALPVAATGVFQLLFNAADIIVVGRFAGNDCLAAVGATTSLISLLISAFTGVSVGVNILIARLLGSGQPELEEAEASEAVSVQPVRETALEEIPDYLLNPQMDMPVKTVDGADYIGLLSLPAISLELPVIDQWSYESLRLAPCRYSGSAYTHNLVILGHNYAGHFRELKKLQPGDAVTFTDMDGNVFSYEVMALETLAPTAVEEMTEGDWDLTLFTCTVGGTTRLAVRCEALDALPARYAEE